MKTENLEEIDLNGMSIITIFADGFYTKIYGKECEEKFTLKDCYNMVCNNKPDVTGTITVLVEFPLSGAVYRYGNHGVFWERIGNLCGYA